MLAAFVLEVSMPPVCVAVVSVASITVASIAVESIAAECMAHIAVGVLASPRVSARQQWAPQRSVQQRQARTTTLLAAIIRTRPATREASARNGAARVRCRPIQKLTPSSSASAIVAVRDFLWRMTVLFTLIRSKTRTSLQTKLTMTQ
jgi:ABC-type transport system involved in cytochrome bd biosynthesis fused ATPase/permease subunit